MSIVFEEGHRVAIPIFIKFHGFLDFFIHLSSLFTRFSIIIIIIIWIMNFRLEGRKILHWKGTSHVEIFYGLTTTDVIVSPFS